MYYPEVVSGYNPGCGYTASNTLDLTPNANGVLPGYACASYSVKPILASFGFSPLPVAWMTTVLRGLANAAAPANASATLPVIATGALTSSSGASGINSATSP